ncbi:hypothetical protein [Streptomyces specialis]|uniref:hypothetical protein n=1 Tax=Streptomyces specialis TaxID=498367 RepID=UPI001F20356C|nr:hypothetical protein [Streptomyces specialis]
MADQFREKAQELQERAREAMNGKGDQKERGQSRDDMKQRGKEAGRKAMDRAKQRRRND